MSDFDFILNPVAGQGAGGKLQGLLEKILRRRGVRYTMHLTEGPGHATKLARTSSAQVVVAVGGDGTINEVANGLVGSEKHLGIIPAGSGNDFIKSVNLSSNLTGALDQVISGNSSKIDVGMVVCSTNAHPVDVEGNPNARCFVNGIGIGFDAAVAVRTRQIRFLTGVPLYLAAVFQVLGRYKSPHFKITSDSFQEEGRKLLIAVGNGTCAGGGFYLTPDAVIDDGLLDVCLIEDIPVPTILRILPRVLWGGHRTAKQAKFRRCKELNLTSSDTFYVHADGEIVGDSVRNVGILIKHHALSVITGSIAQPA
jgi:diacylglycerol kinase (ATP)